MDQLLYFIYMIREHVGDEFLKKLIDTYYEPTANSNFYIRKSCPPVKKC
jgi:hypothetical protein